MIATIKIKARSGDSKVFIEPPMPTAKTAKSRFLTLLHSSFPSPTKWERARVRAL
jgi:hypothetical protein